MLACRSAAAVPGCLEAAACVPLPPFPAQWVSLAEGRPQSGPPWPPAPTRVPHKDLLSGIVCFLFCRV